MYQQIHDLDYIQKQVPEVGANQTCSLEDLYPTLAEGSLLKKPTKGMPAVFTEFWPLATSKHFQLDDQLSLELAT
jgi:hypothetical protein